MMMPKNTFQKYLLNANVMIKGDTVMNDEKNLLNFPSWIV